MTIVSLLAFLRSERAALSTDWLILSAALVGTGVAILSDLGEGPAAPAGTWSRPAAAQSGSAPGRSPALCVGGIDRLRAVAASRGEGGLLDRVASMADAELRRNFEALGGLAGRDDAMRTALECEMAARGFGR